MTHKRKTPTAQAAWRWLARQFAYKLTESDEGGHVISLQSCGIWRRYPAPTPLAAVRAAMKAERKEKR